MNKIVSAGVVLLSLSACGGGGNVAPLKGIVSGGNDIASGFIAPIVASSSVAGQCQAPRAAGTIDPSTSLPYGDVQGSLTTEKQWIRAYVNETYLWYADVAYVDASKYVLGASVNYVDPANNTSSPITLTSNYDVVDAYFNSQRSTLFTASGKAKDPFHFTYTTTEWQALSNAGATVGFGFQPALITSVPPRSVVVAYTDPATPASANGISRGATILAVNGVSVTDGDPATLNEGLFSPVAGKSYTFSVLDLNATTARDVTMVAGTVTSTPVQNVRTLPAPHANVGYLQFNDHIATAESELIAAVNTLKLANGGAGVSDLVLDLRYNGGGLLDIASEFAYMIAGSTATTGKTFEKLSFNDKNPYNFSAADSVTPFHATSQGFSTTAGQALPQLGLARVFVLVGAGTCSASEAIINGLTGIGVQVVLIGNTTCGKPYGFFATDNCSTTYFTIQFKGVNQAGFGDYADGFIPGGSGSTANNLPGCSVADDFTKPLGDITEARLAAALQYRANGSCGTGQVSAKMLKAGAAHTDVTLIRSIVRENRIYRSPLKRN